VSCTKYVSSEFHIGNSHIIGLFRLIINFYRVVYKLNRLKIKTNRGKQWSKSTIRFILLSFNNVLHQLIEENSFKRAVKLLNDNKK